MLVALKMLTWQLFADVGLAQHLLLFVHQSPLPGSGMYYTVLKFIEVTYAP
jgi:hypothetical protein